MSEDKPVVDSGLSEGEAPEKPQVDTKVDSLDESGNQLDTTPKKKSGKGKWFLVLLILLLLMAAAVGGWYFANEQVRKQQSGFDQAIRAELSELDASLAGLRQQLSAQSEKQGNIQSAMIASSEQTESQLLSLANRISQSESNASGDWVLAEAEYLLRIANQRLVTSQDIDGAIEMMKAADNILMELAYPELTEVRRQLVSDLTRLSLVQPVDYEGIYFALDSLLPSIAALSLSNVERIQANGEGELIDEGWRKYWSMTKRAFSPYVVINSTSGEPQYLVSDEQESLIKSQIQLQVRQAQLAMLSAKTSLYTDVLDSASEQVNNVFTEDPKSKALAQSLSDLAQRPVSTESLNISESIRALETVVDQFTRIQTLDSSAAGQ